MLVSCHNSYRGK
ncbi:hypothetical protein SPV_2565 [Streptococcus pneumoniae]|nr:hypothetical protein SPV_2565 [Streptococcus pneumoniae]